MSRLAKKAIELPKGVEAKLSGSQLKIRGPKGELELELPKELQLEITSQEISFVLKEKDQQDKATVGLYRSLINNRVIGVSKGFEKKLQLIGVGYRAALKGQMLDLQLGFSHPCEMSIPKELKVDIEKNTLITIKGIDKQLVGHFAALVRSKRPPEPYKGKGVRYVDEYVRKKAGKTAKGKG